MEIYDKNHLGFGLLLGLLTPIVGFGIVYFIFELMVASGIMDSAGSGDEKRMRTMLIIAICANIFWVRKFNQPYTLNTLRGIVMATMIYCAVWFAMNYDILYAD